MRLQSILTSQGGLILYTFIGGIALLAELTSFFLLTNVALLPLAVSNGGAMFLGMLTSFTLNSRYNFKVTDHLLGRFFRFATITCFSYICSTLLLVAFVQWLHLPPMIAKLATLPVVLAIQFTLNKKITFAKKRPQQAMYQQPWVPPY